MAIIVSKKGTGTTSIVEKSGFAKEDSLQEFIHDHPEAIPVYDIQKDKRLFVVAREFATESGPIDALAVDRDGDIYLVETKLYSNSDKRKVVAQVLDYGASLWKHFGNFDKFLSTLNQHTEKTWSSDFQTKVQEFFELAEENAEDFAQKLESNLSHGNLKFVVLMDAMDDRLKDLITYINQNSKFDIYGVQLEYYKHDEYEIAIPKIYGVETKKDVLTVDSKRRKWGEQEFLAGAEERLEPAQYDAVKAIYDLSKSLGGEIQWGSGTTGSFNVVFNAICQRSLFSVWISGTLAINFGWLGDSEIADRVRDKFKQGLEANLGLEFPLDFRKRSPRFPIEQWGGKAKQFEAVVKQVVGEHGVQP